MKVEIEEMDKRVEEKVEAKRRKTWKRQSRERWRRKWG